MMAGLRKIGIDLIKCDIFITHLHADYFGLVTKLASHSGRVYFSRTEKEMMDFWEGFDAMLGYAGRNGLPWEKPSRI